MSRQGKVWLVGAGPGDVGLFTIKGKDILAKAEVVVYDSLVGDGVLTMVPEDAEKINVGRKILIKFFWKKRRKEKGWYG